MRKFTRRIALALILACLPFVLSIASTAAATSTTVTREIGRHAFPNAICLKLTQKTGCNEIDTITQTVTDVSPLVQVFVKPASASTYCWGPVTVQQQVWSAGNVLIMATGNMRFNLCYDASRVEVGFLQCWVSTAAAWGGGNNYCESPGYKNHWQNSSTWLEQGWYFYPYTWPWYHINQVQEWGANPLGAWPIYFCNYC